MTALAVVLATAAALSGSATERGTIGTYIEFARQVQELHVSGARESLVPFAGSHYFGTLWRDVLQGHAVYHWRERRLYLIHDFFCTSPATGGTMPYTCESATMVVSAPLPGPEDGGVIPEELLAELKGDYGEVQPHPTLPLFAGVRAGWCDDHGGWCGEGGLVTVHDLSGRPLCGKGAIPLLMTAPDGTVWSVLGLAKGVLTCPDGERVRVPGWREVMRRHSRS